MYIFSGVECNFVNVSTSKKIHCETEEGQLPWEVCDILFHLGFQSLLATYRQSVSSRKVKRRGLNFCVGDSVTQVDNTPATSNQETEATHGSAWCSLQLISHVCREDLLLQRQCHTVSASELWDGISAWAVSAHWKFASGSLCHAPLCTIGMVCNTVLPFAL